MIALYGSYLSLALQMVYPVSEIHGVTNKNPSKSASEVQIFLWMLEKREIYLCNSEKSCTFAAAKV